MRKTKIAISIRLSHSHGTLQKFAFFLIVNKDINTFTQEKNFFTRIMYQGIIFGCFIMIGLYLIANYLADSNSKVYKLLQMNAMIFGLFFLTDQFLHIGKYWDNVADMKTKCSNDKSQIEKKLPKQIEQLHEYYIVN